LDRDNDSPGVERMEITVLYEYDNVFYYVHLGMSDSMGWMGIAKRGRQAWMAWMAFRVLDRKAVRCCGRFLC
jgi:hypothetical protein